MQPGVLPLSKDFVANRCVFYFAIAFISLCNLHSGPDVTLRKTRSVVTASRTAALFYQSQLSFSAQSHLAVLNSAAVCWIVT